MTQPTTSPAEKRPPCNQVTARYRARAAWTAGSKDQVGLYLSTEAGIIFIVVPRDVWRETMRADVDANGHPLPMVERVQPKEKSARTPMGLTPRVYVNENDITTLERNVSPEGVFLGWRVQFKNGREKLVPTDHELCLGVPPFYELPLALPMFSGSGSAPNPVPALISAAPRNGAGGRSESAAAAPRALPSRRADDSEAAQQVGCATIPPASEPQGKTESRNASTPDNLSAGISRSSQDREKRPADGKATSYGGDAVPETERVTIASLIERYRAGKPLLEMAKEVGLSEDILRAAFIRAGVPISTRTSEPVTP